jgi:hypothetical protein
MQHLISAAEDGGIVMLAEIAMRQALTHGRPHPKPPPRKKRAKSYRIIGQLHYTSKVCYYLQS